MSSSQLNPLLDIFFTAGGYPYRSTTTTTRNNINIDMVTEEKYIYIYAEMPGVSKDTINVDVFNNKLKIAGTKRRPPNSVQSTSEIYYGVLQKEITLPICVTRKETMSVSYTDGILKICIKKYIEEENSFTIRLNEENNV